MRIKILLSLAFFLFTTPTVFSQINISNSTFLYKSAENYTDCDASNVCFVDGEVQDAVRNRTVPIRIRFPRNAPAGRLPFILWSHGGGLNPTGRTLNETWGQNFGARRLHRRPYESHRRQRSAGTRGGLSGIRRHERAGMS